MPRPDPHPQVGRCLSLLEQRAPRPFTIPEMAKVLGLARYDARRVKAALDGQVKARRLRRIGKTRYQWIRDAEVERRPRPSRAGGGPELEGRYQRVQAGFGFVEPLGRAGERERRDILIPRGMEGAAMHGDRVRVEILRRDPRLQRTAGRVVAVTAPMHQQMVGRLERTPRGWLVVPASGLLPPVRLVGARQHTRDEEDQVVLVRITRPPAPGHWPCGEVERVIGRDDDPDAQFLSVALEHGLRIEFPEDVQAEAAGLPSDPRTGDFGGRRDLRALPFVTIDGETARDFDDAVCLRTEGAGCRLWVAIADVAHYVRPGSPLDREAALRGTSVYFPDRAIPMLPPRLSSELCSLNPARPRLVLVAELAFDRHGRRTAAAFYRAVIESRARLTYTKVAAVLSSTDTPEIRAWRTELGELKEQLERMRALMQLLQRHRLQAGSIDLDLPEAMVDLSEEGRSVGIRLLQRNDAHRLIEEFMLEANRAVASYLMEQGVPLPYRIHEPPDPDDADALNEELGPFGFHLDYDGRVEPHDVQRLLARLGGHPLARVLARQVLRSLKQARYTTANAGHFGLAFPVYCHFTSPIRRYPDLLVHRQLGRVLDGQIEAAKAEGARLESASIESSTAERAAMEAERAMLDLKKAEFMLAHLLEPGPGTIVSVVRFGAFVELDAYPIEGLVRAEQRPGDRRPLRIGERVIVEATEVSVPRRQIELRLLERLGPYGDVARARPAPGVARRERRADKQKKRGRR